MNYILDKTNKRVIWINPYPNKLTGVDAWGDYKKDQHEIIYSLHYNPQIGDTFAAEIKDGVAQDFKPKPVFNKATGKERVLQSWEEQIDVETETEIEPLKDIAGNRLENQVYTPNGWELDIDLLRKKIINNVNAICATKIVSGFKSNALGSTHTYDSNQDDQLNLVGLVSLNEIVMYKCADQNGLREYRAHTADQIKQVLGDGAKRKTSLLQNAFSLKSEIQSASVSELLTFDINTGWDPP
ncbi:hypothetical protein [Leptospira noguchii]|uniref:DUF4376 domain-containing protein n=1 Tax=Leptospira noguchii TaxID=28182 RepID=UPI00077305D9|nr:hypothetical protein [Leptospira noguchii]